MDRTGDQPVARRLRELRGLGPVDLLLAPIAADDEDREVREPADLGGDLTGTPT